MKLENNLNVVLLQAMVTRNLPARLNVNETAKCLGFAEHDIPILVSKGLMHPLGDPAPNAPKYFWAMEVLELASDRNWLTKATRIVATYWKNKRDRQSVKSEE